MVCRSTFIGSAMTSYARLFSHLEEQQTLSVFHQLVREGHATPAPSADAQAVFLLNASQLVRADTSISEARRRSLLTRLESAGNVRMDGRTFYAANRILGRSDTARQSFNTYAETACRDLGLTRAQFDTQIDIARAHADGDRSVSAPREWLTTFRTAEQANLPLDRQTAYAVHQIELSRTMATSRASTRRSVTLTPVQGSSVISAIGYNTDIGRAEVELHSRPGQPYAYRIPPEVMAQWQAQPSLGAYWSRNIRGHSEYQYPTASQSQAEAHLTRCGTCGQFASPSHACPVRDSAQEREATFRRSRLAAGRLNPVVPPTPAELAAPAVPVLPDPQYLERGFRVNVENWGLSGVNAADVIEYEQGELENDYGVNPEVINALRTTNQRDLVWVTANATDADQYAFDSEGESLGVVEELTFDRPALVLAQDGEGGMLVLTTDDENVISQVLGARAGTPPPLPAVPAPAAPVPDLVTPVAVEQVEPIRILTPNGQSRRYQDNSPGVGNSFRTLNASGLLQRARQGAGIPVRVNVSSTVRAITGPDGTRTDIPSGVGTSGTVDVTYNGRGRGYTVTAVTDQAERLQCWCADYRARYDCVHVRQTVGDMNSRLNQASIRDPHQPARVEAATAMVAGDLARDYAESRDAQENARSRWTESDVNYGTDYAAFRTEYQAARARRDAGEQAVPYMTENATDGLGARDGGRAFGVEVEFDLNPGVDRRTALAGIGRDLHAAGLTRSAHQARYGATHGVYREEQQGGWSFEQDPTVAGEIVSPAMFDEPETWVNLQKVCDIVKAHGGTASTRAGQHIHVSAHNYDHTVGNHTRLMQTFAENEDILYRLSANPERGTHRGPQWCRPNSVPTAGYRSVSEAQNHNNSHGLGINLQSVNGRTSDHIEFRTFDSNLEPGVMQSQIKMSLAMTESAFRDTDQVSAGASSTHLGAHRSANRAGNSEAGRQPGANLTGAAWREDTQAFRSFADRMFRRPQDKAQAAALYAVTRWQRGSARP